MIELILAEYMRCQFNASLVPLLCASWGYRRQEKETSVLLKGLGDGEREVTSDKGSRLCQFPVSMEILHFSLIQDFLHRSISPIVFSQEPYVLSTVAMGSVGLTDDLVLRVDGPREEREEEEWRGEGRGYFIERQRGARKMQFGFPILERLMCCLAGIR